MGIWLFIVSPDDKDILILPKSVGKLISLKELYLEGNNLKILPKSLGNLTSFHTLTLGNNRLKIKEMKGWSLLYKTQDSVKK